jgi:hypothetical protein
MVFLEPAYLLVPRREKSERCFFEMQVDLDHAQIFWIIAMHYA